VGPTPTTRSAAEHLPAELALAIEDFLTAARVEAGLARTTLAAYRADLRTT
jgi:hypothetical protein